MLLATPQASRRLAAPPWVPRCSDAALGRELPRACCTKSSWSTEIQLRGGERQLAYKLGDRVGRAHQTQDIYDSFCRMRRVSQQAAEVVEVEPYACSFVSTKRKVRCTPCISVSSAAARSPPHTRARDAAKLRQTPINKQTGITLSWFETSR